MQPLAYLAGRCLVSILQLLERRQRSFLQSSAVLLATGVAHCWAVVYALIISLAMQAWRLTGGQGDHIERLPWWAFRAEQLAVISGMLWWLASMGLFVVRAVQVDEASQGLPISARDAMLPDILTQLAMSPKLRRWLGLAHLASCGGLFLSVLLLGMGILWLGLQSAPDSSTSMTLSQLCLVLLAVGFSLPHAALALERAAASGLLLGLAGPLGLAPARRNDESKHHSSVAMLAAAAEASTMGPQLTVVVACADFAGVPPRSTRLTAAAAAVAFAASVVACATEPPRRAGAAVGSEVANLGMSAVLDVLAVAVLSVSFFHLRSWMWGCVLVAFLLLMAAIFWQAVRELVVELLEPIMPLRSGTEARRATSPGRERLCLGGRLLAIACAALVLRDAVAHQVALRQAPSRPQEVGVPQQPPPPVWPEPSLALEQEQGNEELRGMMDDDHWAYGHHDDDDDGLAGYRWAAWSATGLHMLRWLPPPPEEEVAREGKALTAVAEALSVDVDKILVRDVVSQFRLMLFEAPSLGNASGAKWVEALETPAASLRGFADRAFPGTLNISLCRQLMGSGTEEAEMSWEALQVLKKEAVAAAMPELEEDHPGVYVAACDAWREATNLMHLQEFEDFGHAGGMDALGADIEEEESQ